MSWHKVTIPGFTDSEARQTSAKELEELFKGKCAGALSPEGAALFTRMVPRDAGDSNDAEYYFTPEAMEFSEELVTKYDGQACTPECTPEADWKLSHIAGKTGDKYAHLLAWQRLA